MISLRVFLPFAIVGLGVAAVLADRPVNVLLWTFVALLATVQASILLRWTRPRHRRSAGDAEEIRARSCSC